MSCTYTTQGNLVCSKSTKCKSENKIKENFVVNNTPNETTQTPTANTAATANAAQNCQTINSDFMTVSTRYNCSATTNIDSCAFSFICKK